MTSSVFRVPLVGCLCAFALALVVWAAPTARAEDGEGQSIEEQLKQQMEKILKLMKENEEALLELSTGGEGTPRKVDVDIEPPSSSEDPQGGSSGGESGSSGSSGSSGGSSGSGGAGTGPGAGSGAPGGTGEEIRRRLEELMRKATEGGGKIPTEIEKLIRMIPEGGQGQGQGQPRQPKPQPGEQEQEPEERDGRKQDPQEPQGENEPEGGRDRPRNPDDRTESERDPESPEPEQPRDSDVPPWVAKLPAEIRDSLQGVDWANVPPAHKRLVERYLTWLQRESAKTK